METSRWTVRTLRVAKWTTFYYSSGEGSYEDISESDTNISVSEPLEEDTVADSREADNTDAYSDTTGADSSEEESEEDDTKTNNDGEEDDRLERVSFPIDTWEALVKMNKPMEVILKREHKIYTNAAS